MANAAGGTIQRLKPGPAMVRSRERKPGVARAAVVILFGYLEKCPSLANASTGRIPTKGPGTVPGENVYRRWCNPPAHGCHEIFTERSCGCGEWVTQHSAGRRYL